MYSFLSLRKLPLLLLLAMVLLLAVPGVAAQNTTTPLTITPGSLTITGDTSGFVTRTLVLQAGETITDLTFMPIDLQDSTTGQTYPATLVSTNRTDMAGLAAISSKNTQEIPEELKNATSQEIFLYFIRQYAQTGQFLPGISFNPAAFLPSQSYPLNPMQNGSSEDVTLQFVLGGAQPGRFSGEYLFTYQVGGTMRLPVSITLKAEPFWPAVLLVIAVIVSYLLFQYGLLFKKKDEILRDLKTIQDHIEEDKELADKDEHKQQKYPFPHPFRTVLYTNIRTAIENLSMDSIDNAVKFEEKVIYYWNKWKLDRKSWVAVLEYAKEVYEEVEKKLSAAQGNRETNQTQDTGEVERAQDTPTKLKILINSIPDKTPEEAEKELAKYDPRVKMRALSDDGNGSSKGVPTKMGFWAKIRLFAYQYGSMAVTVVILIFLGFTELYLNNPTFGATLSDYLTLILWGLFVGPVSGAIAGNASSKITGVPK